MVAIRSTRGGQQGHPFCTLAARDYLGSATRRRGADDDPPPFSPSVRSCPSADSVLPAAGEAGQGSDSPSLRGTMLIQVVCWLLLRTTLPLRVMGRRSRRRAGYL